MPLIISVESNIKDLERQLGIIGKRVVPRAALRAIRETTKATRRESLKQVSKYSGMPQKDFKAHLYMINPRLYNLTGRVVAKAYAPNLIRFKARQVAAGVSASAWGKVKVYRGAFIGNQGRTVFKRTGEPKRIMTRGRSAGQMKAPIAPVHGPSVRRTMRHEYPGSKGIQSTIMPRFNREFHRAFQFEINRVGRYGRGR